MPNYRTKEQQLEICEAWKHSKLTQAEFCRQNDIQFYALNRWLRNIKKNTIDSGKGNNSNAAISCQDVKFYSVGTNINSRNSEHNNSLVEIILPSGISIRAYLPENNINVYLRELLK